MARYKKRADGRYCVQITLGYNENGKRRIANIYAKTVRELEEKVAAARSQVKNGGYIAPTDMTVEQYCRKYLEVYKASKSENTQKLYENSLQYHIAPCIGSIRMQNLIAADVQQLINQNASQRRTCEIILIFLRQVVHRAIKDGILLRDVTDGIELPPKNTKHEKRALTPLEKGALLKANLPLPNKCFVYILYGCGLRREEALALRIQDVDVRKTLIHIRQVVIYPDNEPILKPSPKSAAGQRSVNIPDSVLPTIRQHIRELSSLNPDTLLFSDRRGKPFSKTMYRRFWDKIIKEMNAAVATEENPTPIQGLTAHIFRHNYATLLYYSGISIKKAAELMGHSNTNMIMQVYAHLDEEKENTVEKLNAAIQLR